MELGGFVDFKERKNVYLALMNQGSMSLYPAKQVLFFFFGHNCRINSVVTGAVMEVGGGVLWPLPSLCQAL